MNGRSWWIRGRKNPFGGLGATVSADPARAAPSIDERSSADGSGSVATACGVSDLSIETSGARSMSDRIAPADAAAERQISA